MKVALFLRAVNLKGRPLPMADLKAILADVGLAALQTVGASGNAVVEAAEAPPMRVRASASLASQAAPEGDGLAALETRVELALAQALGRTTEVFARSGLELLQVLAANPFEAFAREDPAHLMAVFLKGAPERAAAAALQAKIVGREQVAAGPRCLYATYPDGAGRSKLTIAAIERALGDRGTARNWNTVRRMAELTKAG